MDDLVEGFAEAGGKTCGKTLGFPVVLKLFLLVAKRCTVHMAFFVGLSDEGPKGLGRGCNFGFGKLF